MLTKALSKIPMILHIYLSVVLIYASVFTFILGFIFFMVFTEESETIKEETGFLWWKETTETTIYHDLSERIPYLIVAIVLILVGVVCLVTALRLIQISRRHKRYLPIIKGYDKLFIQQIADMNTWCLSPPGICRDL